MHPGAGFADARGMFSRPKRRPWQFLVGGLAILAAVAAHLAGVMTLGPVRGIEVNVARGSLAWWAIIAAATLVGAALVRIGLRRGAAARGT